MSKELMIREVELKDTQAILDYMETINRETKNLLREPEEWDMTFEKEEEFIKKAIESNDEYMLTAWYNDKLVSCSGYHGSNLKRIKHRVSLGISILHEYQGKGLGTLLMEMLVKHARENNKRTVELEVRRDNPVAIHIYEKIGFVQEGIKKEAFFVDGNYIDLIQMAIYL